MTQEKVSNQKPNILIPYIRTGHPILFIQCPEEKQIEREIKAAVSTLKLKTDTEVWEWTHTDGLYKHNQYWNEEEQEQEEETKDPKTDNPILALTKILQQTRERKNQDIQNIKSKKPVHILKTIYVFKDLYPHFAHPKVLRYIRDISQLFQTAHATLIVTSPINKIPPDIQRDITYIELKLPTTEELKQIWEKEIYTGNTKERYPLDEEQQFKIVEAALGLGGTEAANAYSLATVKYTDQIIKIAHKLKKEPKDITPEEKKDVIPIHTLVLEEKAEAIKKSGILEYWQAKYKINEVGGTKVLKKWLEMRKQCFSREARAFGLAKPKGVLLVGLPGTGKSLIAKSAASSLEVPLIKFDIGKVFGGLVGQSEQNMLQALQTIDAIGASCVWLDELEKVFGGVGNQSGDSGVSQRVFGLFLSWLQEKQSSSFIVATVNKTSSLPPELTRKGRFDEVFYIDLPSPEDRAEILDIHIRKKGRDPEKIKNQQKELWEDCIKLSDKFSGSELEECINNALLYAFNQQKPEIDLTIQHIHFAIKNIIPLAKSREDDLSSLVKWAKQYAINANYSGSKEKTGYQRYIDL